jgi:hypothetical protein
MDASVYGTNEKTAGLTLFLVGEAMQPAAAIPR